jgi:hypothetical protein
MKFIRNTIKFAQMSNDRHNGRWFTCLISNNMGKIYLYMKYYSYLNQILTGRQQVHGRIQDFKLGWGGPLKKNCAEWREVRNLLGYFVWKITILRQKIIFFPILGGARPLDPPLRLNIISEVAHKKCKRLKLCTIFMDLILYFLRQQA